MIPLILLGIIVFAVIGLVTIVPIAAKQAQIRKFRSESRVIFWDDALKQVLEYKGYFLVAISGRSRQLFYVPGEMSRDPVILMRAYEKVALIVEHFSGLPTVESLRIHGLEGKYVELNSNEIILI